ncbi:BspA family leucine-rich repeat surface protein [Flavobacteriaceae bacterium]|nr:BspA family leucine-rich repeat surface protein [Flavobacteriaceae bacterium]
MNNLKNNFFIFLALIFCGFLSFAQGTFFLDSNGVTVKCTGCVAGNTGTVGGVTYTAVDDDTIGSTADGDWDTIVTTLVTDMSNLFKDEATFNEDISSWDTSSVTTMVDMFNGALAFNQPLNSWNVSSVTRMDRMFSSGDDSKEMDFNQDIGDWDVSNVTNMSYMFYFAVIFDQPINNWDTSNVTTMEFMFGKTGNFSLSGAMDFNQDIGDWNVGKVQNFRAMFRNSLFNQDLSDWDVSSATNLGQMFDQTKQFNNGGGSLSCWDTSSATDMDWMFYLTLINQDLSNWCVASVGAQSPIARFGNIGGTNPTWGAACTGNSVVISFNDVTKTFGDSNFTVAATSNRAIPITYSIADTSIATINASSGQITILKSGITTVTASQDDGLCISGSSNMTLTINQQLVNIEADDITLTYGDPAFNLNASSLVTDRGFTFTISDGTIGSISGNSLSVLKPGTTNITVSQAANDFYAPISKVITLTVNKQTVNINANDIVLTYGDPAFTLTASSSPVTDRAFTFTIENGTIGSISGNVLSVLRPGTTNITISQASNDLYSPISKVISLTVNKATPTLDFPEITKTYGDSDFTPTVTTNSSGNITFSVSDALIASSLGSSLSIVGAGQTNVTVNIDETENYLSISGSTTMTVNKGTPTIIFNDITKEIDDPDFNINPTSDSSGLMSFSIADSSIASISGNTISILRRGTTTVTVNQSETSLFNSGSATMILTVNGASFDISWYESRIRKAFSIGQYELKEPTYTSDYDGEIRYVSSNLSIGNFTGKTLNFNKIGRVLLSARFEGSDYYQDAVIQVEFDILKDNQVIIPSELPNETPLRDFISIPIPLSATSTSGAPVYIKVEEGSAANLSGTLGNYELITNSQTGIVSITYFTVENDHPNYYPAALHFSLDVVKLNQNITFNPEPALEIPYSENLEISINAISDSNLDVSVNKLNVSNNILENNTLSINDLGQVYINAEQEGNQFYNPTTANRVITIIPAPTELSDFSIPEKFIYDDDFEITPPTSSRDGEIIYTSDNPEVAVVSGTTIFIIGIGTCNITAYMESIDFYTSSSISSEFVIKARDTDQDSVPDEIDNCPDVANPSQLDDDMDGIGNECDPDSNGDGIKDDLISVSQLLTPGTTGSESTWQVQNIEFFPNSIVYVYNRNGQLVFQKNSYQNDWNGTYQKTGSFLPAGPYYFVVEISDTNEIKKGWLYINY